MNHKDHYKETEEFFKTSAVEKDGYYDSIRGWPLKHTVWQMMVRKRVLEMIHNLIKANSGISKIIDVGCGRGDFTLGIAKRFPQSNLVLGSDFVEEVLTIAQKDMARNVKFQQAHLLDMPFDDGFFDLTACINVIHHIPTNDLEKALSELSRITEKYLILEIKNINNFLTRRLIPLTCDLKLYPTSVEAVSSLLKKYNLHLIHRRNILYFDRLSPVCILLYRKQSD